MAHPEFEDIAALDAIGAASPDEEAALAAHLASCADCRRARDEFAEAATLLARELPPVPPPRQVRSHVVESLDEQEEQRRRFGFSPWWLATAATLFLALWGWRELGIRMQRERMTSQRAEIRRLAELNAQLAAKNDKLNAEMTALAARDTKTISLSGQQVAPSASARVFLEPDRRRAVVFFSNLPANPSTKSYQLWVIAGNPAKPQSAGVFDVSKSGSASISIENLPVSTEIKGLAVTLEPRGGVTQPTNTTFYVSGST